MLWNADFDISILRGFFAFLIVQRNVIVAAAWAIVMIVQPIQDARLVEGMPALGIVRVSNDIANSIFRKANGACWGRVMLVQNE